MRILIIGAGDAGRNLAAKLSAQRHDIVIIDRNEAALNEVAAQLDIQTIHGEGCSPRLLERAGLSKTDLVVAVTDRDEVNILACALANAAGVRHKVARVSNADFLRAHAKFDLRKMGIDLIVSQNEECADEVFNILRMPGTIEALDLLENRALAVGIKVHMDSPLVLQTLKQFPRPDLLEHIRMIGLLRGEELIIPRGDTQLMIGDELYFCGEPAEVRRFLEWANPEDKQFEKVIIAGGGDLGFEVAARVEKTDIPVVLIERDTERAEYCSEMLDKTLVIKGDALNNETLENAGIVPGTAFFAATGSDERNIMLCLLAEKGGASFTVAHVTKPEYVPVISSLSLLDRVVSAHVSMINAILHFVRGKNVKAASQLHKLPGELLDVVIAPQHRWADKPIASLKVPDGVVLATILREDQIIAPTGNTVLRAKDRVVLFARPDAVAKIQELFKG